MVIRFFYVFLLCCGLAHNSNGQEDHIRRSIYFPGGQYYITDYQLVELRQFLDSIPDINQYDITIHSHTDNIGGVAYNQWLSEMRSATAIQELVYNNILKEAIRIKDFGQYNPIYSNDTWQGRQMNRRVDIIFWPISF